MDQNAARRRSRNIFCVGLTFAIKFHFVIFRVTGDRLQELLKPLHDHSWIINNRLSHASAFLPFQHYFHRGTAAQVSPPGRVTSDAENNAFLLHIAQWNVIMLSAFMPCDGEKHSVFAQEAM